jgi:signal transduction histidine kinase
MGTTRDRIAAIRPPLEHALAGASGDPHRRAAARAEALAEIGIALSSILDVDALLREVMDRAQELLEAERSTLFLVDRERGELWSKVLRGLKPHEIRLPIGKGIAGWVAKHGRPVVVADAYDDPRFDPSVDKRSGFRTRAVMAVPIRGRDERVLGVIEVLNRKSGAFGADEERLLAAVASQAGVAIENARLFAEATERNAALAAAREDLQQKVGELDLLRGLERLFTDAPALDAALDALLERSSSLLGAKASAILLRDGESGVLQFRGARGGRSDLVRSVRLPIGQGIAGTVVESGLPIVANEIDRERTFDASLADRLGYPVRSAICVPLIHDGEVHGAIELLNKPGGFEERDLDILLLVAELAAHHVVVIADRERRAREQRLATIGQLLSGVMHDLKTPLAIISGYAQLMAMEEDGVERQKSCKVLLDQFSTIDAMTREVLDFAKGKVELLKRKVLVNVFTHGLVEYLKADFEERGIDLRVRSRYTGPWRFDEMKVRRAVINIARNAAQAMGRGGRFTLHVAKLGDRLVFRMSDTGPGIPEEVRGRLFESFATHGKAEGTGLGLAIVKRIAEEHGGTIGFRTGAGKGTTFILTLPP